MERIENVELDDLVRQLNAADSAALRPPDQPPVSGAASRAPATRLHAPFQLHPDLGRLLRLCIRGHATDVHLMAGEVPRIRVDGELQRVHDDASGRLDGATLEAWLLGSLDGSRRSELDSAGAIDLSAELENDSSGSGGVRFRVHIHRLSGGVAASLRRLPAEIPDFAGLRLPEELVDVVRPMQGLVLVCGPTGSGKSSTMAAMVRWINEHRAVHVLTLEDPVEYRHPQKKALIRQLEIGVDTPSFAHGLRAALRQDPDVILLGEMRDLDSIEAALQAAETGHLVLSTVHTSDSAQAIQRVVDVFPEGTREQARQLLAGGLNSIICQRLLPRIGGGVIPAVEILRATHPVRHHIRSGAVHKLYNELVLGRRLGMMSLEQSLAALVARQEVRLEDALVRSTRPEELESLIGSGG